MSEQQTGGGSGQQRRVVPDSPQRGSAHGHGHRRTTSGGGIPKRVRSSTTQQGSSVPFPQGPSHARGAGKRTSGEIDWDTVFQAIESHGDLLPSAVTADSHGRHQPLDPVRPSTGGILRDYPPFASSSSAQYPPPQTDWQETQRYDNEYDMNNSWASMPQQPLASTSQSQSHPHDNNFASRQHSYPFLPDLAVDDRQQGHRYQQDDGYAQGNQSYNQNADSSTSDIPQSLMDLIQTFNTETQQQQSPTTYQHPQDQFSFPSPTYHPGRNQGPMHPPSGESSIQPSPTIPGPSRPSAFRQQSTPRLPPILSAMPSAAPTPNPFETPGDSSSTTPDDNEDKRVRNTMASAKFRAKKKEHMATIQRNIVELEEQQTTLEADVANLRQENGLLREMVQLKYGLDMPRGK